MKRLRTYHRDDFNIYTERVDPTLSRHIQSCDCYPEKIRQLYANLGVQSAIWTMPEEKVFHDHSLQIAVQEEIIHEFVLEVAEDRIAGYVDETKWTAYVEYIDETKWHSRLESDKHCGPFTDYSKTPQSYDGKLGTSVLIETPIRREEVKECLLLRLLSGRFNRQPIDCPFGAG